MSNQRESDGQVVAFAEFVLDRGAMRLSRGTKSVHLAPQPLQLLSLLVESGGRLVSREEVQLALWPDRTVEFNQSLGYCLRKLREALGDGARKPVYIETVPRLGFRFLPAVTVVSHRRAKRSSMPPPRARTLGTLAATCCALTLLGWVVLTGRDGWTTSLREASAFANLLDLNLQDNPKLHVEVGEHQDPALYQQALLLAKEIPRSLEQQLGRGLSGSLHIGFEAGSDPPRLRAELAVEDHARLTIQVVPPAEIPVSVVATDLAHEFARQLLLPQRDSNVTLREEVVTLEVRAP